MHVDAGVAQMTEHQAERDVALLLFDRDDTHLSVRDRSKRRQAGSGQEEVTVHTGNLTAGGAGRGKGWRGAERRGWAGEAGRTGGPDGTGGKGRRDGTGWKAVSEVPMRFRSGGDGGSRLDL